MEEEKTENKEDLKNEGIDSIEQEDAEKLASDEDQKEIDEKQLSPENEILELKDKLARTFAEMENQRRRFEKEKDEAFEYGGFSFARESLNLLENGLSTEFEELKLSLSMLTKIGLIDLVNEISVELIALNTLKKLVRNK